LKKKLDWAKSVVCLFVGKIAENRRSVARLDQISPFGKKYPFGLCKIVNLFAETPINTFKKNLYSKQTYFPGRNQSWENFPKFNFGTFWSFSETFLVTLALGYHVGKTECQRSARGSLEFCKKVYRNSTPFKNFTAAIFPSPIRVARFLLGATYQSGKNLPNDHKIFEMAVKHTKLSFNVPNGHKIYQHCLYRGRPKCTQTEIFWYEKGMPSGNPGSDSKLEECG
jgi:hypothetical protein